MNRSWFFTFLMLAFSFAFVLSLGCASDAQRKTRELIFEEKEEELANKDLKEGQMVVKVKTTVLLKRNGKVSQVLPSHQFKSGDRLKLVYTTNVDAYVYWLAEGTSGDHVMLFPNAKTGMDNMVKKNQENMIPVKGSFRLKPPAGTEKVMLIMSPKRIPELDEAAKVAAVKSSSLKNIQDGQESKRKSHDLVFEDKEDGGTGVSTQSQVMDNDITQPFVVVFELKHTQN